MESTPPRLLVGLGNPGREYEHTRHNIGFLVLDRVLARLPRPPAAQHLAESHLWSLNYQGTRLHLQKPLTFMNLSGKAVAGAVRELNLVPAEVLVVYDDADLPLGRLRLRTAGSSGGHRGIESILQELGSGRFGRLRLGIGRGARGGMIDHVLSPFAAEEQELLERVLTTAVEACFTAVRRGVGVAMNQYNGLTLDESTGNEQTGEPGD
jgi:PTH1 family peptidyl-tRNA hydrolase